VSNFANQLHLHITVLHIIIFTSKILLEVGQGLLHSE